MEFKFIDFVKEAGSLDSIHGNRGNLPETGIDFRDDLKADVKDLERLEKKVGEKLWAIDKGYGFVYDFVKNHWEERDDIDWETDRWNFERDVKIYKMLDGLYMNVKRVVLPPPTQMTESVKRIYILKDESGFYKLPLLSYPNRSLRLFLTWLKRKKKIKLGKELEIWNKNIKLDEFDFSFYPMKNIKSEEDLKAYNVWIVSEFREWIKNVYNPFWKVDSVIKDPERTKEINPSEIEITQEDISEFVRGYNGKFKIER